MRLVLAEEVQLTPPGANYFVLTPEGSKRERREKRSRLAAAGAAERAPEDPPTGDGRGTSDRGRVWTPATRQATAMTMRGGERTVAASNASMDSWAAPAWAFARRWEATATTTDEARRPQSLATASPS